MSVKITYFVHGTTTDNEQGLATGWNPGKLSATGLKQAKELGELVKDQEFDQVFCSDLDRAVVSAHLAFGDKYEIQEDQSLREANYGNYNGKPSFSFKENMLKYVDSPFPGGESYEDVSRRMRKFLLFLKEIHDGEHIAIVAHEGPQLALEVLLNQKTWEEAFNENWRNTGAWQPGWEYILE